MKLTACLVAAAAALLAAGAAGPAAAAPCAATAAYNGSLFNYERCQIPDVDQRRNEDPPVTPGLPNKGSMYCYPASALDLLTYLADQGFPSIPPGPGYWGPEGGFPPQGQYNTMTAALGQMGTLMGTDPIGGTKGGAAELGIKMWLLAGGVGDQFTVSYYGAIGQYVPLFANMAVSAVDGAFVMPGVGWYKKFADLSQEIKDIYEADLGVPLPHGYYRNGGHAMALTKALGSLTGNQFIGVRDPGSPNDGFLFDQSSFSTDTYGVVSKKAHYGGYLRVQSKVVGLGSNAFLDNYIAIKPKYAVVTDDLHIVFVHPIWPTGDDSPAIETIVSFPTATGEPVIDFAIDPEQTTHPYLVEGSNTIWQIDALTGRSTRFATVGNPERIAFGGPEQTLYVLGPRHLVALDRKGRQIARAPIAEPLEEIAYDEDLDELVGISEDHRRLLFYDENLELVGTTVLPEVPCGGKLTVTFDPVTGDLLVHCDRSPVLLRIVFGRGRTADIRPVELDGAESPVGLTVDDAGHVFVSEGGTLAEFDASGRRVESSPFNGLPGGSSLDVSRSFSNFDPLSMSDARFRNVLPEDSGREAVD